MVIICVLGFRQIKRVNTRWNHVLHVKHKINHSSDVNNLNLAKMYMHKLKSIWSATIYTVIGLNDRQLFEKLIIVLLRFAIQ